MLKLKMMLRDDVAAGRRQFCAKAVCQSVRPYHASGVDNATPPTGRHHGGDYSLRGADHYAKTTGRNQKYINEQCR